MFRNPNISSQKFFIIKRSLSAIPAASIKPSTLSSGAVKQFEEMPTLSKFELMKRFMAGGKFHKTSMLEINKVLREELGTIYRMPGMFGQNQNVTTFDADDIEHIHRNEGLYPFRRGMETLKYFRETIRPDIFSVGGLMVEQNHEWHSIRSVANPILMKPRLVKSYIPLIDQIVTEFMENISKIQDENGEMPGNFHEYLNRWTLESITAITLEKRLGLMNFDDLDNLGMKVQKTIRKIFNMGMDFEIKPSVWKIYKTKSFDELMQAYNDLTNLSAKIIDEALENFDKNGSGDTNTEQGILFKLLQKDKNYAIVMAFDMIFAAVDTTSSALAFIMYCLAKNPQKQEKLRAELLRTMPHENTPLNEENMKNLPYLRAVIKESLRLYPPATMNMRRVTSDDFVLRGYHIPKGTDIILGMIALYKDSKYFESPNEFIPERFLRPETNAETCPMSLKQKHPFAFLPFGYGPRFCVGKRIAEMELETFICRLFRKYQVGWNHPDMKVQPDMVLLPGSELRFKLSKI